MHLHNLWPGTWIIRWTEFDRPLSHYGDSLDVLTASQIDHFNLNKLAIGSFKFSKWASFMIDAKITPPPDPRLHFHWSPWGLFLIHAGLAILIFLTLSWLAPLIDTLIRDTPFNHAAFGSATRALLLISGVMIVNLTAPYVQARLYVRHHIEYMDRHFRQKQKTPPKGEV